MYFTGPNCLDSFGAGKFPLLQKSVGGLLDLQQIKG